MNKQLLLNLKETLGCCRILLTLVFPVLRKRSVAIPLLAGLLSLVAVSAQAQTITAVTVGTQTGSLTYGTGGTSTYDITVKISGTKGTTYQVSLSHASLPSNVSGAFGPTNPLAIQIPNTGNGSTTVTATLTVTSTNSSAAINAQQFTVTTQAGTSSASTTGAFTIAPKQLTPIIIANNKIYDKLNTATISESSLSGIESGDDVALIIGGTATFSTGTAGVNKTVSVTGLALDGVSKSNYSLPSTASTTATITRRTLTVTGAVAASRVYNGTEAASVSNYGTLDGIVSGDVVSLKTSPAPTIPFTNKNVGTNKTLDYSGVSFSAGNDQANYVLNQIVPTTASITAQPVTYSGTFAAVNKVYDGTRNATLTATNGSFNGVITGDDVIASSSAALFADKNVGTNKSVSGVTLGGVDGANYSIIVPTMAANITPKDITGTFTAENKYYDGSKAATIKTSSIAEALLFGDVASLDHDLSKAEFDNAEAGPRNVTMTKVVLQGADASNYNATFAPTKAGISAEGNPLPVSLIAFEGRRSTNASIKLTWATASEKDNDYFLVERSQDGRTFTALSKAKGAGNSNNRKDYSFTDAKPLSGVWYYRLKQVDFDGKFEYSKVIAVTAESKATASSLEVYPNPTQGKVSVNMPDAKGQATVTVSHSNGRTVLQQQVQLGPDALEIDLSSLRPGIYFLQVKTATGTATTRVLKQ